MGRKIFDSVDGYQVDEFAGAFSGAFDVDSSDARYMAYDDEVLLVVRARVKVPRLRESRNGDITRINILGVKEAAIVRSESLRSHLCQTLGLEEPAPQLPFDDSSETSAPGPQIQASTTSPLHSSSDVQSGEADALGGFSSTGVDIGDINMGPERRTVAEWEAENSVRGDVKVYDPKEWDDPSSVVETVKAIKANGRKDKALEAFLSETT